MSRAVSLNLKAHVSPAARADWMLGGGRVKAACVPAISRGDVAVAQPARRLGPDAGCREPGRGLAARCRSAVDAGWHRRDLVAWPRGPGEPSGTRASVVRQSANKSANARPALGRAFALLARLRAKPTVMGGQQVCYQACRPCNDGGVMVTTQ